MVLVVEDDSAIRNVIHTALTDEGLRVQTASDGRAALEAANYERPALVLLDMMLPDATGSVVAAELKARCGEDLPVIIVTADTTGEKKAAVIGAVGHVAKPFDVNNLVELVLRHVSPAA